MTAPMSCEGLDLHQQSVCTMLSVGLAPHFVTPSGGLPIWLLSHSVIKVSRTAHLVYYMNKTGPIIHISDPNDYLLQNGCWCVCRDSNAGPLD